MECDVKDCENEATIYGRQKLPHGGYVNLICEECDAAIDNYWDAKFEAR